MKRRGLLRLAVATGLGLAFAVITLLGTNACIEWRADGYVFDTLDEVPPRPYAIVLGARVRSGQPSRELQDRLDCGYELYAAGRVERILVTADDRDGQDEIMARALIARGVPADRVVRDGRGHRTRASMENAAAAGITGAIVCTQAYHQARSVVWARHEGIDAVGWRSDRRSIRRNRLREVLARTLAWFELLVD